jgi:hypothetical protein
LEIVLGVKALAGSNPASSAREQAQRRHPHTGAGVSPFKDHKGQVVPSRYLLSMER